MGILRIVLAIVIVMEHSVFLRSFDWIQGTYALKIFFIMSGFYMTFVLDRKYTGKGSYSLFLSNRFLRLYPIYWAAILITVGASYVTYLTYNNWGSLLPYFAYHDVMNTGPLLFQLFTNIFLFGQDLVFLFGLDPLSGSIFFTNNFNLANIPYHYFLLAPHAWSLGVELTYYLIAPYLTRRNTKIVVGLILLSLFLRAFLISIGWKDDPWNYRFFPTELVLFLIGTLSYRIYKYIEKIDINVKYNIIIVTIFFVLFFFYNYIFKFAGDSYLPSMFLFVYTGLTIPFLFQLSKKSKLDYRLGEMSYPIYIVHIVVIRTITLLIEKNGWNFDRGIPVLIITIVLSYLLLVLVSDPIEKYRQKRVLA